MEGVKRELAKGADVNGKTDYWANDWIEVCDIPCLTAAVWSQNENVVSRLLMEPGINVDATDYMDFTALHQASRDDGQIEIVRQLLASGANVNCKNDIGQTPLSFAVKGDCKEVVSLLMGAPGIDIETKDRDGQSPLYLACKDGNLDIARILLTCGANVNCRATSGKTPLMVAFETELEELIFLLLEHPVLDVNARDSEGMTALHWAFEVVRVHRGIDEAYGDCVQILAEKAHVDLDAKDNSGRSIEQIAW